METITWQAELTDTFGGEANYGWVRRATFEVSNTATQRQVVAAGKAALGMTGERCRTTDLGDSYQLHPIGTCTVAFLTPTY